LAQRLGLTRTKVYKWNWDRRNNEHYESQGLPPALLALQEDASQMVAPATPE
jgi:hypothetical protein